jgi:hypothetical protein
MRRIEVSEKANGDSADGIGDAVPVKGEAPSVVMN